MAIELFADNATTTLASSPSAGATSFTVASSSGFPAAVTGTSQFRVLIGTEIVTVTNVSGTTWTCTALAAGHTSGDAVSQVVTAAGLGNLPGLAPAGGSTGQVLAKTGSADYALGWVTDAAGGGDYFRSGYYSHGLHFSTAPGNNGMTQDFLLARPFVVPVRRAFDRLGINVSAAAGAGGVMRLGIYTDGGGKPSTLLVDAGTVSATATGSKEATIALTLDPGIYWPAVVAQGSGTPGSIVAYASAQVAPGSDAGTSVTTSYNGGYAQVGVSGALPGSWTGTSRDRMPMILLRAT
jgi:hypothetical protein